MVSLLVTKRVIFIQTKRSLLPWEYAIEHMIVALSQCYIVLCCSQTVDLDWDFGVNNSHFILCRARESEEKPNKWQTAYK